MNDIFRHRLQLLKCLPLKLLLLRCHYQDTVYLPRPQSLAIVLGVFKLNYQVNRDKGGNGREERNGECFTFPSFIKNLEKACTRGSAANTRHVTVIHLIFIQCSLYKL